MYPVQTIGRAGTNLGRAAGRGVLAERGVGRRRPRDPQRRHSFLRCASLIRNNAPLELNRVLGWPWGRMLFLMSEVPLYVDPQRRHGLLPCAAGETMRAPHPIFYLRKRVLKLVFLSQVPYKFVNLFFALRIS